MNSTKKWRRRAAADTSLSPGYYAMAGFYSGGLTRALCQPLDVVKIRFQLQEEPICRVQGGKYSSLSQAFVLILREEGWKALWKGHIPAQGLSVIYGGVQFGSFEFLSKKLAQPSHSGASTSAAVVPGHIANFVAGCLAGVVAVTSAHPLDVLRTRLVAQSEKSKKYHSMRSAFSHMYRVEGPKAFFRGWVPAVVYVAPYSGLSFALYKLFTRLWKGVGKPSEQTESSMSLSSQSRNFLCGASSGTISKAVVYPFDVLKKRLQIMGFEDARRSFGKVSRYSGTRDAARHILKHEGFKGFYKGLAPSLIKAGATTGLAFLFFEQAVSFFKHYANFEEDE